MTATSLLAAVLFIQAAFTSFQVAPPKDTPGVPPVATPAPEPLDPALQKEFQYIYENCFDLEVPFSGAKVIFIGRDGAFMYGPDCWTAYQLWGRVHVKPFNKAMLDVPRTF